MDWAKKKTVWIDGYIMTLTTLTMTLVMVAMVVMVMVMVVVMAISDLDSFSTGSSRLNTMSK